MCVLFTCVENLISGFRSIHYVIREYIAAEKGTRRFHLCLKQMICDSTWTLYLGPTVNPTQASIELPSNFKYAVDVTDPTLHLCFNIIPGHLPLITISRHSLTTQN